MLISELDLSSYKGFLFNNQPDALIIQNLLS